MITQGEDPHSFALSVDRTLSHRDDGVSICVKFHSAHGTGCRVDSSSGVTTTAPIPPIHDGKSRRLRKRARLSRLSAVNDEERDKYNGFLFRYTPQQHARAVGRRYLKRLFDVHKFSNEKKRPDCAGLRPQDQRCRRARRRGNEVRSLAGRDGRDAMTA
jgi:hypothetical protein